MVSIQFETRSPISGRSTCSGWSQRLAAAAAVASIVADKMHDHAGSIAAEDNKSAVVATHIVDLAAATAVVAVDVVVVVVVVARDKQRQHCYHQHQHIVVGSIAAENKSSVAVDKDYCHQQTQQAEGNIADKLAAEVGTGWVDWPK